MNYDIIIGLEIHAELKTRSKMFCSCDNDAEGKEPNTTVCPVCLGHPGTLPVPNKQAIEWTILLGLALHGRINTHSKFDRKNYFYPDLPKGYQISQYDLPLVHGAGLEIDIAPFKKEAGAKTERELVKIQIKRIHLEEDTGKLTHPKGTEYSLVDYNRAGTPLLEMVTEPVIRDAATAKKFCQRFREILRYLDISDADMEKGQMRCEANVSLQVPGQWRLDDNFEVVPTGRHKLNPKVELKNINSFKAVEKAIEYEIKRQSEVLDNKGKTEHETRGWNENSGKTVVQRTKETAADYRYFPEPDIPPLNISSEWLEVIKTKLMELPQDKKERFMREYLLSDYDAEILVSDKHLADYTEEVISELREWVNSTDDTWERQQHKLAKAAANWLISELFKHLKANNQTIKDIKITPENFAELITLVYQGKVNSSAGQQILEIMYTKGGDPTNIMADLGLEQIDDTVALEKVIKRIIRENPEQVKQYRSGKEAVFKFFVGQTMAATKGKANPKVVSELLKKLLKSG